MVREHSHHTIRYVSAHGGRSVTGIGGMAGSVAFSASQFTGYILQLQEVMRACSPWRASAYLVALVVVVTLAPGLKKVEVRA